MTETTELRHEPAESHLCPWQTGYGLPWSTYCGAAKGAASPYCAEHLEILAELNSYA